MPIHFHSACFFCCLAVSITVIVSIAISVGYHIIVHFFLRVKPLTSTMDVGVIALGYMGPIIHQKARKKFFLLFCHLLGDHYIDAKFSVCEFSGHDGLCETTTISIFGIGEHKQSFIDCSP